MGLRTKIVTCLIITCATVTKTNLTIITKRRKKVNLIIINIQRTKNNQFWAFAIESPENPITN